MKLKTCVIALTLLLAGLFGSQAATAAGGEQQTPTVKSLLGKKFVSVKVVGGPRALKDKELQLRFFKHASSFNQTKKPTMGIGGACNSWGAGYQIRKGRLAARGIYTTTKVLCRPNPDRWLQSRFRKSMKARTIGNHLVLTRPAEGLKLVFKRVIKKQSVSDEPDPNYPVPVGVPATVESVEGKTFESVKVIGEQVKQPIKISFSNGRLGAYLGCNWMSGQYQIGADNQWMENGQLSWFDVNTTDMACQLSKDSWFVGLLDKGVAATVKDSWLVLARGETTIVLKQVAESNPPERVPAGKPSTIESLDGRSFESVSVIGRRLAKPIEVSFWTGKVNRTDEEGEQAVGTGLGAYLGCNWMGGEYEIKDGQLRWFDAISTAIGCYGGGNERDAWFNELLNQGVEVSESEAGLIFDRGSTQIVFKETQV